MKIGITGAARQGARWVTHSTKFPHLAWYESSGIPKRGKSFHGRGYTCGVWILTAPQTCRRFSGYRATGHRSYRRPPTGVRRRQHTPAIQAAADSEVRHVLYI